MRVLLDTQALLWWVLADPRLGTTATRLIASEQPVVSVASLWEIAIKSSVGKLSADVAEIVAVINDQSMDRLPISDTHVMMVQQLPMHHRDPFDRVLVAQAIVEDIPLLTSDTKLAAYQVHLTDARQ